MRPAYQFSLFIVLCMPLLSDPSAYAQISPDKFSSGRMDKSKWGKAGQTLRKAIARDSLNPEARYLMSLFYFTTSNPSANLDSALVYFQGAQRDYFSVSMKERDRLRRVPLDSMVLVQLSAGIDSVAFERAKHINTETSYEEFISVHPRARQRPAALELRDEVAFLDALKSNTWFSFQNYLTRHSQSHRRAEAQSRYDRLLYEDKTRSQQLIAFEHFCQQHPTSPYRLLAEKNILEIATAAGTVESFRWFIANYLHSPFAKHARNILFTREEADGENSEDPALITDSLRVVRSLNQSYWIPIFKGGLFGFMDEQGTEVVPPRFEKISEAYRCGEIRDRLLVTSQGLMARNGTMIWKGPVLDAKDLGIGFMLVSTDSGSVVLHESGLQVGARVQGAQVLANSFIAVKRNNKWGIFSLAGRPLLPFSYDDATSIDSLIVLTRGAKKIITTPSRLGRLAEKADFREEFVFDEVRRWASQAYWVRNGTLEGVINGSLRFIIPLDRQVLRKTSFGYIRGKEDKVYTSGLPRLESVPYKSVQEQAGWIRLLTTDGKYFLYEKGLDRLTSGDSVWLRGQLAFVADKDSLMVLLPSGQRLMFLASAEFQSREYRDSSAWLVFEEKKKKAVYDAASGIKMFSLEMDQVEPVAGNMFIITKGTKRGLVDADGKVLVPAEYDAIVPGEDATSFSLLKDKKFGWYDASRKFLMKPVFDRNIKPYNTELRLAFRDKGYAFLGPDGKPIGNFEWEEVSYWTDSIAWVKKNFQWMLRDIRRGTTMLAHVHSFNTVFDSKGEKIYRVRQESAFGVISSRKGVVVPLQYSDVVNLGSREVPLYFTERHIEEAGISVVVYYDQHGKIVRKQAMEADEFEKIYCDN